MKKKNMSMFVNVRLKKYGKLDFHVQFLIIIKSLMKILQKFLKVVDH